MDIDYNKLKSFLSIVRSGSVTAAAKNLNRTQSAVSQALHALEKHLGLSLIEWEGKRLKLTRQGQRLYQVANKEMKTIEDHIISIVEGGHEISGRIELGLLKDHSTTIEDILLPLIAKYRMHYPAVTFNLKLGTSSEIEEALLKRELDMGFLINFRERQRFHVFQLATEEHILVSSPNYLDKMGPITSPQELIAADLIDIDERFTCLSSFLQKHAPELLSQLDQRKPSLSVSDFKVIKKFVLLDQGVALLPKDLIKTDLKQGKLLRILTKLESLRVGLDCAIERGHKLRPCEELFMSELKQA